MGIRAARRRTPIRLDFLGTLIIAQGKSESLVVGGDDNLLPLIETVAEGDQLVIRPTSGQGLHVWPTRPLRYRLTVRELSALTLVGAGAIRAQNLHTSSLRVELSGAGAVTLGLHADRLEVLLGGAGGLVVSGAVREQQVTMSGAGSYSAGDLLSKRCTIRVAGIGGARVNCTDALDAEISGLGSISYAGQPAVVHQHVSGLGHVGPAGSSAR